jgi:hypothetical protein
MLNFIVGYFVCINIIAYLLIWFKVRTTYLKLDEKILNIAYILISILGGFVGLLVGREMFNYERNSKIFKRWIPLIIVIEVCIALAIIRNINL